MSVRFSLTYLRIMFVNPHQMVEFLILYCGVEIFVSFTKPSAFSLLCDDITKETKILQKN